MDRAIEKCRLILSSVIICKIYHSRINFHFRVSQYVVTNINNIFNKYNTGNSFVRLLQLQINTKDCNKQHLSAKIRFFQLKRF